MLKEEKFSDIWGKERLEVVRWKDSRKGNYTGYKLLWSEEMHGYKMRDMYIKL